jgi:hypothetical protein
MLRGQLLRRILLLLAFFFLFFWLDSRLYADRHTEVEVKKFMSEVEATFNDYIKSGVIDYAPLEVQRARKCIESAKKFLAQDERDQAFYELKKAAAHFRLFDAKRKMVNAEFEFDHSLKSGK